MTRLRVEDNVEQPARHLAAQTCLGVPGRGGYVHSYRKAHSAVPSHRKANGESSKEAQPPEPDVILPPDLQCVYPGCTWPREEEEDLCEGYHSGKWPNRKERTDRLVANDGIVDWQAIGLTVQGLRRVNLTWVERDIAIAMLLGQGYDVDTVLDRTGYKLEKDSRKYRRLIEVGRKHYGPSAGTEDAA